MELPKNFQNTARKNAAKGILREPPAEFLKNLPKRGKLAYRAFREAPFWRTLSILEDEDGVWCFAPTLAFRMTEPEIVVMKLLANQTQTVWTGEGRLMTLAKAKKNPGGLVAQLEKTSHNEDCSYRAVTSGGAFVGEIPYPIAQLVQATAKTLEQPSILLNDLNSQYRDLDYPEGYMSLVDKVGSVHVMAIVSSYERACMMNRDYDFASEGFTDATA